ncbi:thermonuclease family protein [Pseudonocardia parietis]|uniref:Micrococcal nuclease n=1 Tax=Pseudonocardia parietis TaxID=570936 RepID=A0ABS4VT23_9PSEU|nr:thermonuclease family protein [Pseudonocardia parietis]MBP2366941.1 micrococcal nuclease [Pseudonocardia parietis]
MIGKLIVGVVAVTSVAVGAGVVATAASTDGAVVTHIVDGDTFDATVDGRSTRIRLLNIDTPETKDPNADVECLGPEAAARLAQLIPVGSTVSLSYDEERIDPHGRTLAGVYDGAGTLVNAELAREGLGTAVLFEPNDRFYDDVLDAQEEARTGARGLYAGTVACTLPARVDEATSAVADMQREVQSPPSDPAGLDRAAQRARALIDEIGALRSAFTGPRHGAVWAALSPADDRRLTDAVVTAQTDADALHTRWTELADGARERIRLAAEQAERDRIAQQEADRAAQQAAAEQQAADEQAAREEEQRRLAAAPPAVTAPAAAASSPAASSAGSGCDANYSPCVPISATDLDCGDLSGGPYTVIGSDPHRLDNDDPDNLGCEAN